MKKNIVFNIEVPTFFMLIRMHYLLNMDIIVIHCLNLWCGIHDASNGIRIELVLPQLIRDCNAGVGKVSM
jgi:hypothetical protein